MFLKKNFIFRLIFLCIIGSFCFYQYLDKQNKLTFYNIKLTRAEKAIFNIKQEMNHLQYEVNKFESPENLIKIMNSMDFSHMSYPLSNEVIFINMEDDDMSFNKKEIETPIYFACIINE